MSRAGMKVFRLAAALALASRCFAQEAQRPPSSWPGAELFANGRIRHIRLELSPDAANSLRNKAREYVRATVVDGGNTYTNVGIHLKGSVGSFRNLDDKPSLTLDFSKFNPGQKFHDLRKIHLNNSLEDPSYLNEIIGSEVFRAAGVPTPRATRSLVSLNGRPLGLYVLKEGFTEDFLACHFKRISDQLYEPEAGNDVDGPLKRNSVITEPGNADALRALAGAVVEPEPAQRWRRLNATIDMERFLTFMSLEIMLGHRDGYCLARNNFRVYHDADSGRVVFFAHGMDQLFGTADLPWQPQLGGLVARSVMAAPEGKQRYTERFRCLFTNAFIVANLTNRVDQLVDELRPTLSVSEWAHVRDAATMVQQRIVQRQASLVAQLNRPPGQPLQFASGSEKLRHWQAGELAAKGKVDEVKIDGHLALHIAAAGETATSWKTAACIPRGRYRFEGRVKIASVQPLPYGVHHGAGLRIRGAKRQTESFIGDSHWRLLTMDFQVEQAVEEVEFICELRARGGDAWFDLSSLRVVRTGDL